MTKHTPGPWVPHVGLDYVAVKPPLNTLESVAHVYGRHQRDAIANANLIAAAPDLLEAAQFLEKAEKAHANCEECEGEEVPELCKVCFPLFDDARVKRRLAIAKAVGRTDSRRV